MIAKSRAAEDQTLIRAPPRLFALFRNIFERFHDEASSSDHGGPYGDVCHIGPGSAEHNDHHEKDFAGYDEDHCGDYGSLGCYVEEETHETAIDGA